MTALKSRKLCHWNLRPTTLDEEGDNMENEFTIVVIVVAFSVTAPTKII